MVPAASPEAAPSSQIAWTVTATSPDRKDPVTLEFDHALGRPSASMGPDQSEWTLEYLGGGQGRNCYRDLVDVKARPPRSGHDADVRDAMSDTDDAHENLGRFRFRCRVIRAAFDREQKRLAAMKLADPWSKLAAAYAADGRNDEALRYLSRALERADGDEARKPILELASRLRRSPFRPDQTTA